MACSCGDDGKVRMEDMRLSVIDKVYGKYANRDFNSYTQIDWIVRDIAIRWGGAVTGVPTDPGGWSAVEMIAHDGTIIFVECDRILDGFYLGWQMFFDRYGEKVEGLWDDKDED